MLMGKITDFVVAGGRHVVNNAGTYKAAAGLAMGAAGGLLIGSAMLRTPTASKNSQYLDNLMFPNDLIDESADRNYYMAIQFVEYQRRSIFNQPFLSAEGGLRLPIPNNLVDTQGVSYTDDKAEAAQGAAIEAGLKGRNGVGSSGGFTSSIAAAAVGALGGRATETAAKLAGGVTGLSTGQALQLGGLAQNPFLTVLFNSPEFKMHTFSWTLAPNNEQESNTVKEIISTFKSNMLPAMSPNAGGTLLTYPNMAIINLYPNEDFLYKFKPCVVTNLSVNFAKNGPSFFRNTNAPTEVELSVSFKEIEYWLKEDIEGNSLRSEGSFY
jgi:hypothetical protein